MTEDQMNELLSQINVLVDNTGSMTEHAIYDVARNLQRMAANLPRLRKAADAVVFAADEHAKHGRVVQPPLVADAVADLRIVLQGRTP